MALVDAVGAGIRFALPGVMDVNGQWLEPVARIGYTTKGILYLLLGGLAVAAAVGAGGKVAGSKGVLATVAAQPYGRVLLSAVAVGLLAYTGWRVLQAIWDPEADKDEDRSKRGIKRAGFAVSAALHGLLAYTAIDMGWLAGGSGGASKRSLVAKLLTEGWGQWLVGLAGVAIGLFALTQLRHVFKAEFMDKFATGQMSGRQRAWVERSGRAGYAARVVVFAIISAMVVYAAISTDPSQAKSTGGALRELASQPFGATLLGIVAGGLALYGLHQFFKARWRVVGV